ncbi:unnamed protein product [Didymodactylos carnosus]|uniref:Uncharacterized protein n=1 Tax=Didymodactylos carnosus TaxID=1234261 RepID=A0A815L232_9BILA|nr:unnamed protein product [Didymodactylos carnosus]CAF1404143.1 unnamed protein product [Didymodactylos carnosus]CAF4153430.1 unnamed protein product [Didymodactylos carnosus]CAF4296473.1 unnamed protein product [Didymodactylos carnosus]
MVSSLNEKCVAIVALDTAEKKTTVLQSVCNSPPIYLDDPNLINDPKIQTFVKKYAIEHISTTHNLPFVKVDITNVQTNGDKYKIDFTGQVKYENGGTDRKITKCQIILNNQKLLLESICIRYLSL